MKTILKTTILSAFLLSNIFVKGQEKDNVQPLKIYDNNNLKLTIGGRFMADAALYNTDYTKMKSGASIVEGRVRTSLTYNQWYFYADFDFVKNKAHQKNIFLRYNFDNEKNANHSIKVGYYNEPSSMALNTSKYNLHFFTRASSALALSAGRALGVSYKYYDDSFFFNQGIFSENNYNNQKSGNQGFSVSGRWLYKPFGKTGDFAGHIGVSGRYAKINTGTQQGDVLKTQITYKSPLETRVDGTTEFLMADIPWASNTMNLGFEALFSTKKFFVRGEYLMNKVYKNRPDEKLFTNQLGGLWSWQTLESWQKGNPIRDSKFSGFYVEAGHLLMGGDYSYNNTHSVLGGANHKGDLEVVARYSLTDLNDITDGDFFLIGKEKFYPGGVVSDYPPTSTTIAGGKLQTAVLGLNYTFNEHAKMMLAYQFSKLNNVYFPNDKNFHILQTRVMFSF